MFESLPISHDLLEGTRCEIAVPAGAAAGCTWATSCSSGSRAVTYRRSPRGRGPSEASDSAVTLVPSERTLLSGDSSVEAESPSCSEGRHGGAANASSPPCEPAGGSLPAPGVRTLGRPTPTTSHSPILIEIATNWQIIF